MTIKEIAAKIFSGNNILPVNDLRYLPRWVVYAIDIAIVLISLFLTYFLVGRINKNLLDTFTDPRSLLLLVASYTLFMYVFRTYAGVIRHSTFIDLLKILLASVCSLLVSYFISRVATVSGHWNGINTGVLLFFYTTSFSLLLIFRVTVKQIFSLAREFRRTALRKRVFMLGIDSRAIAVARAMIDNPSIPYELVGFITQRKDSQMLNLLGRNIYIKDNFSRERQEALMLNGVIIIREMMSREELNEWVSYFLERNLRIYIAPSVQKLRDRDLGTSIKSLQIEDLLNRKPIRLDNEEVHRRHRGKSVLITGGSGSIGSEIVRQVAEFHPEKIIVLDQAETPLHEVELELRAKFPVLEFEFVLADVCNKGRLEEIFQENTISMVYHAAAYKHVPMIEQNPTEAITTNILGSRYVADLAMKYGINRFVMVSTDKAVNPTNVMGASKRAAELYVQSLQSLPGNRTKFITTRFGNVLGSNGSVIPHFKKQIEAGGPVTITHKDIVRYFMTIPEACELVLEAGTMGSGGEIYVFDMGEPVKIVELARRMIRLSGFTPDEDIKITYTGLRPGEKLFEELLTDGTRTLPTHHEKIMISRDATLDYEQISQYVAQFEEILLKSDPFELVAHLKKIVPEYRSQNSRFQKLDVPKE